MRRLAAPTTAAIPGLIYRAQVWNPDYMEPNRWQAAATYVTGAHNMKFGYQGVFHLEQTHPHGNNHNLDYRVNNGVPNQLTQFARPYSDRLAHPIRRPLRAGPVDPRKADAPGSAALRPRLELLPGAADRADAIPPEALVFPESKGVIGYHDINPRLGLAYDVFGNGKTALKFNTGRYLEAAVNGNGNYSALRPSNRVPTSVTRSWTDANRNFTPDCDLLNGVAQDLRRAAATLRPVEQPELREGRLQPLL